MKTKMILALMLTMTICGQAFGFVGGDGSPGNPYQIATQAQLENVNSDLSASYILLNDINLAGTVYTTAVIAADQDIEEYDFVGFPFTGSFDGAGYVIRNLKIEADHNHVGLFGSIQNGSVSNLGVEDVDISGVTRVGGLVAHNVGGTITNCHATGTVKASGAELSMAGVLVGWSSGTISNCYAVGTVEAENAIVGGLVGRSTGIIRGCNANVSVTGDTTEVGGLVGLIRYGAVVEDSYAIGQVTGGTDWAGGLVGRIMDGSFVINCYATGAVSGEHRTGGLVGENAGLVRDSYATGNVNGGTMTGGLVARDPGSVVNCRAEGNVTAAGVQTGGLVGLNRDGTIADSFAAGAVVSSANEVGGLVGRNLEGFIVGSYATGSATATGLSSYVGGLVGWHTGGIISRSYATGAVSGEDYVGGLVGNVADRSAMAGQVFDSFATGAVCHRGRVGNRQFRRRSCRTQRCRGAKQFLEYRDLRPKYECRWLRQEHC